MACDQVTVARKLADLAARPPIHVRSESGETGMQLVDRWITGNTMSVLGMHLTTYVNDLQLCCCAPPCQVFSLMSTLSLLCTGAACTTFVHSVWVF